MNLTRWKSPQWASQNVQEFHYKPIRSRAGMRLARLWHGSGSKGIAIDLLDSFVPGQDQQSHHLYDALSYTWGESKRTKAVWCNKQRLLVTPTLLEALQHFRHPEQDILLWIDQICICQDRLYERMQQVQMMGAIFKGAQKVSVWLGPHLNDSRAGVQLAKQLLAANESHPLISLSSSQLEVHGLPKKGHRRWKALGAILRRAWFWRTWVIQEVVLNPCVEFVVGDTMFTWKDLEVIVMLLEGPVAREWHFESAIRSGELPFCRINRIRTQHQLKEGRRRRSATTTGDREPTVICDQPEEDSLALLDLLLMTRDLGATEPHDKVYALLGLGRYDIIPDYESRPETVFNDFALDVVGGVTKLFSSTPPAGVLMGNSREVRNLLMLLSCAGKQNQQLDLHSWAPDWTVNLISRPLMFWNGFCAGGDIVGKVDWHHDTGLQLVGKLVDTIGSAGSRALSLDSPHNTREAIAAWWQEAKTIAHSRTVGSPGSTASVDAFEALRRNLGLCEHGFYQGLQTKDRFLSDNGERTISKEHDDVQTLEFSPTKGRIMFVTTTGYLGLAPLGSVEGDLVYIVLGVNVPFILRPLPDGACTLIGEAYVQGIMHGEALKMGLAAEYSDVYIR